MSTNYKIKVEALKVGLAAGLEYLKDNASEPETEYIRGYKSAMEYVIARLQLITNEGDGE